MAEPITEALRQLVTARAQGRCEYCQSPEAYAPERFSIAHIQPRILQGPTVPANLALACQGCNGYKSAQTTSVDPELVRRSIFFIHDGMSGGNISPGVQTGYALLVSHPQAELQLRCFGATASRL